jgi:hypothetical protein
MTTAAHIAQSNSLADLAARIKTEHETVIRAELFGSDACAALRVAVCATAPVLALCRRLVVAGYDPALPLEAWRGPVLCLRVRSIGEAAQLRVATHGGGFERSRACAAGCTAASPVEETPVRLCPTPGRPKRTSEAAVPCTK